MACDIRRVFLSSTTNDLLQYREVAQEVMQLVNTTFSGHFVLQPVSMDTEGQDGERATPLEVSRSYVRGSDWVVLIVAWNYGYVPPGSSCSVTEAEYLEALATRKKLFVFLPGDLDDKPEFRYRALDGHLERENLADWRGHPAGKAGEPLLADFKRRLRESGRFDLFRHIEDFRARLTRTLIRRVTAELFTSIGPEIVSLGLQQPLQACIQEVKLLARLKRLHDTLHQIRQFGIRTWREELLTSWPDDGDPPYASLWKYSEGKPFIVQRIERIDNIARELPAAVRKELRPLDSLVAHQFPRVPACGKGEFIEATEDFASRVQRVFTAANAQMVLRAAQLERDFQTLASCTRDALQRNRVPPSSEDAMRQQLERAMQVHERLQEVLNKHRQWQAMHDEFERIDHLFEGESLSPDGADQARRQRQFARAAAELIDGGCEPVHELLDGATELAIQSGAERLDQWPKLILAARKHLDAFVAAPLIEHYEALRKHFDDLFFQIDLETLHAVESAEDQVRAIESGLSQIDARAPQVALPA